MKKIAWDPVFEEVGEAWLRVGTLHMFRSYVKYDRNTGASGAHYIELLLVDECDGAYTVRYRSRNHFHLVPDDHVEFKHGLKTHIVFKWISNYIHNGWDHSVVES